MTNVPTFADSVPTLAPRVLPGALLRVAPLTGLTAAAVNAGIYFVAHGLGLIPAAVLVNGQPLTVVPVIISSILPVLVAAGVFALLGRFTKNPVRIFTILAGVLLIASFVNPYVAIPGVPPAMAIVLNLMHVVVAGLVVYSFRRYATTAA